VIGVDQVEVLFEQGFDVGDLAAVRRRALEVLARAGVAGDRARSFVYSVNEGLTNAIRHGGGRGTVRIQRAGAHLVAEVRDPGVVAPFAVPETPPRPDQEGGRGLRMARQLCDRLTIRTGAQGTSLVLEVLLAA
jgi:serine/threonine-protein kinase RsbW